MRHLDALAVVDSRLNKPLPAPLPAPTLPRRVRRLAMANRKKAARSRLTSNRLGRATHEQSRLIYIFLIYFRRRLSSVRHATFVFDLIF